MDECEELYDPENVPDRASRLDPLSGGDGPAMEEMAGARPKVTGGAHPKVIAAACPMNSESKRKSRNINSRSLQKPSNTDIREKNRWGDTYVHKVIRRGDHKELKNLLDKDERVTQEAFRDEEYQSTLLHEAVYKDCTECLKLLVDKGGDLCCRNDYDETLLHKAMKFGRMSSARFIINNLKERGELEKLINSCDNKGNTPLNVAVKYKQEECATLMIEEGADVNLSNKYGNTPLHRASFNGCRRCVDLLLKHKASVELKNKFDETALHRAALRGNLCCVTRLLKSEIDKDDQDENGNTALHNSSRRGHYKCTFHLLKAKVDKDIKNYNGETAEDLLKRIRHDPLMESESYEWIQCILSRGIQAAKTFKTNECNPHEILTYKLALTIDDFLGAGSFGTVHKGYDYDGQVVAIKKINTSQFYFDSKGKWRKLSDSEILPNIKELENPNVVKILDFYNDEKRGDLWIVMEFCETTLQHLMRDHATTLSARRRICIMIQAMQGLSFLHGENLVHRDIKVDNILILYNHPQWPWVKISDFSFAKDLNAKEDKSTIVGTAVGCRTCIAPELLDKTGRCRHVPETVYTQKIDIYSMGLVLVFTCLTRRGQQIIFFKKNCGHEQLKDHNIDVIEEFFKSDWEDDLNDSVLVGEIRRMLSFETSRRPDAAEMCDFLRTRYSEEAREVDREVNYLLREGRRADDEASAAPAQAAGAGEQNMRPKDKPTEKNSDVETSEETMLMKPVFAESQQSADSAGTPLKQLCTDDTVPTAMTLESGSSIKPLSS